MPVIHANVWKGFGEEPTKKVIKGITKVVIELGIPEQAVEVIVHEIPKTHWGIGGQPASDKFKDIGGV
jgi:4-oxalocrotonate tautomerase